MWKSKPKPEQPPQSYKLNGFERGALFALHIPWQALFAVLIGLLFLFGAAWTGKTTYALKTEGIHVEGTVIDVIETQEVERRKGQPDRTVTRYRYVVEFNDSMGKRVEFKDSIIDSTINHKRGDKVPVLYLRDDAADSATIDHGWQNWLAPIMFAVFGVVIICAGAL
jgi:hypothetical protein